MHPSDTGGKNEAIFFQENEGSQASSGEPKASLGLEFEDLSIFEKGMDTSSPNYTSKISISVLTSYHYSVLYLLVYCFASPEEKHLDH